MALAQAFVFLAVIIIVGALLFPISMHRVSEGHIGVYWIGGALQTKTTTPGFHFMIPLITTFANVQITLQTDVVKNIPCGTSGGSVIYFDAIEVVNRLRAESAHNTIKLYGVEYDKTWIFDKIHHEINQFCSSHSLQEVYIDKFEMLDEALAKSIQESCDKWSTGIEIIAIRVTKPRIPEAVRKNYEEVETSKTRLLVEREREMVARKEEEVLRMRATMQAQRDAEIAQINAEKEANISMINSRRQIAETEAQLKKEKIMNEIYLSHEKALTDAEYYSITKQAEANQKRYTEEYLRYVLYTSLANNTKIYFGEKIPTIFADFIVGDSGKKLSFP